MGPTSKKNVVLMVADDLGKYLGCYGCKSVTTPNIDKLAAEGTRFDLGFASTASCSGSRSTMYTGLHTHQNGQYGLLQEHFTTLEHVDTLPKIFNSQGYITSIIAKVHVGTAETYPYTIREQTQKTDPRDVLWMAEKVNETIVRAQTEDKPFFATVAFHDPHRDVTRSGFANEIGPLPPQIKDITVDPKDVEIPPWLSDVPELRNELTHYYRAIYRLDQGVGFVLDKLRTRGVLDDTLIIFVSDNGPPFINAKATLYDAGSCLPVIIKCPGKKGGLVSPNLVSFVDFLPTALEWTGIPLDMKLDAKSPNREGRSLLRILERGDILPDTEWDQWVFCSHTYHQHENYWPTRVLRTRKWKYHRNIVWQLPFPISSDIFVSKSFAQLRNLPQPLFIGQRKFRDTIIRPQEELFDMENDPNEATNLAGNAELQDLLKAFRTKVESWQFRTEDRWLFRDSHSVYNIYPKQDPLYPHVKETCNIIDRWDIDPDNMSTEPESGNKIFWTGTAL